MLHHIVMHGIFLAIGAVSFLIGTAGLLVHAHTFRIFFNKISTKHTYSPTVSVLAPVRGMDIGFEKNISSLLRQKYKNKWEIIFIIDKDDTETEKNVRRIIKINRTKNARVVNTVLLKTCSGKSSALLTGLKHAKYDVVAGCDSDFCAKDDWLETLVGPLEEENVGATTGYRFYIPSKNFKSYILSAWNAIGYSLMIEPFTFVWGGSFAIKKSLMNKLGIPEAWKKAISDDIVVTKMVRKAKLGIHFVPGCVVKSTQTKNFNLAEFTNRQVTIVRWGMPKAIKGALVVYITGRISFFVGLAVLYMYATTMNPLFALEAFLMLWPNVFLLLKASLDHRRFRDLIKDDMGSRPKWIAAGFIAQWLMSYNVISALRAHKIMWRGREYDLRNERFIE